MMNRLLDSQVYFSILERFSLRLHFYQLGTTWFLERKCGDESGEVVVDSSEVGSGAPAEIAECEAPDHPANQKRT